MYLPLFAHKEDNSDNAGHNECQYDGKYDDQVKLIYVVPC